MYFLHYFNLIIDWFVLRQSDVTIGVTRSTYIWNSIANFCIGLIWYWAGIKWHLPPYVFIWWIIFSVMQGICGTFFNLISLHSAHRMVAFLNLNIMFQSLKLAWNQSVQSAPSMPVLCKPHHYFVKIKFLWKLYLYLWLEFSICVKGFKKVKSCCKLFW